MGSGTVVLSRLLLPTPIGRGAQTGGSGLRFGDRGEAHLRGAVSSHYWMAIGRCERRPIKEGVRQWGCDVLTGDYVSVWRFLRRDTRVDTVLVVGTCVVPTELMVWWPIGRGARSVADSLRRHG